MRERCIKFPNRASDAAGKQMCGGIFWPLGQARLDVGAGGLKVALGKQHGRQQVMEHGIAGVVNQTLFAQPVRFITPARIEGGGGPANEVLGGVLVHPLTFCLRCRRIILPSHGPL
jgi:hypothetical protein